MSDPDSYSVGSAEPTKKSGFSSFLNKAKDQLPPMSGLSHQLRQQTARLDPRQNAETLNIHLLIKAASGVVHDHTALAREEQLFSKQLFTWSSKDLENEGDLVDICDRAAFLQYKNSELQLDAAAKLEQSRAVMKDIRNFENDLVPRRRNAVALKNKITALQKEKENTKREEQLGKLQAELSQLEAENATFEESFHTLKRSKLHEAFSLQYAAQQELAEKSAIVARYGATLLRGMETDGVGKDYKGHARTARVKVELEEALKNWSPAPPPQLQEQGGSGFLDRSDTRSFGTTHADQLSLLESDSSQPAFSTSDHSHLSAAQGRIVPPVPPHPQQQQHGQNPFSDHHAASSGLFANDSITGSAPPLPPRTGPTGASSSFHSAPSPTSDFPINLSPTARPDPSTAASPPREMHIPLPPPGVDPSSGPGMAPKEPTVAETGAPKVGTGGPSSGVLRPRGSSLSHQQKKKEEEGEQHGFGAGGASSQLPLPGEPEKEPTFNAAGWGQGGEAGGINMPGGFGGSTTSLAAASGSTVAGSVYAPSEIEGAEAGGEERLPTYHEGEDDAMRARERAEEILAREREEKRA
ncbi:hypothetical protein JCM8547_006409 [Rhodosporidiobolus lusitaniae]